MPSGRKLDLTPFVDFFFLVALALMSQSLVSQYVVAKVDDAERLSFTQRESHLLFIVVGNKRYDLSSNYENLRKTTGAIDTTQIAQCVAQKFPAGSPDGLASMPGILFRRGDEKLSDYSLQIDLAKVTRPLTLAFEPCCAATEHRIEMQYLHVSRRASEAKDVELIFAPNPRGKCEKDVPVELSPAPPTPKATLERGQCGIALYTLM